MAGPPPKRQVTRQRRNSSGARTIAADARAKEIPEMPVMGRMVYHPMTVAWWNDVWTDPVSSEYTAAHKHGLYRMIRAIDRFWKLSASNPQMIKVMAEIRQQEREYGLNPRALRGLQVEVERGEEAVERTTQRKARRTAPTTKPADDPRALLKAVK